MASVVIIYVRDTSRNSYERLLRYSTENILWGDNSITGSTACEDNKASLVISPNVHKPLKQQAALILSYCFTRIG